LTTPQDVLELIAQVFADAELPYALIGGHAINAFLQPRFTADIDLTVQADPRALARVRAAFEAAGYRVVDEHGALLPSGPDFVRFHGGPDEPPIELQVAKTSFQEGLIVRASKEGPGLAVATAEDLIVLKLIANRPKDLADLAGLVELSGLDWGYIEDWAREWDVLNRLARVRRNP